MRCVVFGKNSSNGKKMGNVQKKRKQTESEGESTLQRETTFVQSGGRERDNVDLKQQKTENKNHENDKLTKVEGTA